MDGDIARMYRRAMDVQGRKCATRVIAKYFLSILNRLVGTVYAKTTHNYRQWISS